MLCGVCGAREARIFYTEIINGEKREQYLCEECAAKSTNFRLKSPFGGQEFSLGGLLAGLFEGEHTQKEQCRVPVKAAANLACAVCGMTYEEFKEKGEFGCAKCYQNLGRLLLKNRKNIQGSDIHTGKKPKNSDVQVEITAENVPKLTEIERLSMQLEQAVEREEYETAAMLRDKIRSLKQVKGEVF